MNPQLSKNPERIQAWVDGELPEAEARALATQLERDPETLALAENLRRFGRLLRDHEPARAVPESREFYWSKIARRLEAEEAALARASSADADSTGTPLLRWLLPWILPAGAAVLAAFVYVGTLGHSDPRSGSTQAYTASRPVMTDHEVEAPSAEMTTVTFYSAQDGMTVVWLGRVDLI